jgi:hypothetical protein
VGLEDQEAPRVAEEGREVLNGSVEVVEEAGAEDRIKGAIRPDVSNIVIDEAKVVHTEPMSNVFAFREIHGSDLDPERAKPGARELDGVSSLKAPKVHDGVVRPAVIWVEDHV